MSEGSLTQPNLPEDTLLSNFVPAQRDKYYERIGGYH